MWVTENRLFLGSLSLFTIFILISTFSKYTGFFLVQILIFIEHVKGEQTKKPEENPPKNPCYFIAWIS